ncbi:MAG: tetratricopeptide repeat protein [Verrucomicrobiota bacterium]
MGCSVVPVRADAAADLYNQGINAFNNSQYPDAAAAFDKIIADYPTYQGIDDVRIHAGVSQLFAGKYHEAIDRLTSEAAPNAKPAVRGIALYYTALAQFSAGQKDNDNAMYTSAAQTLTTLLDFISKNPTPDNNGYTESAYYYRALSYYELNKYDDAETDLIKLTTDPQFASSLMRPDYFLQLGSSYGVQTNQAVTDKKSPGEIAAIADKALDAYDQVARDPNALVQANEANMDKAQIYFLEAQLDPSGAGYQKALDAFRQVKRKADLIPAQQQRLDDLHRRAQQLAQASAASGGATKFNNDITLLINREQSRFENLQSPSTADPIIEALIRIAECYVNLKQPDEARTILHRLIGHATLTADQQQQVDFQTLYSYVLGGQTAAANKALDGYLAKHAGDPQADFVSYQIAADLAKRQDYPGALAQAQRSIHDFPKGRYAADALALQADLLNRLGRRDEADKVIADFLAANPTSPVANQMFLTKAQSDAERGDFPTALADYQKVRDNASAGPDLQSAAYAGYIQTLNSLKRYDDVIREATTFQGKYPASKGLPGVLFFAALAQDQKHDPAAVAALQDIARKFPQDQVAPFALAYVVNIYQRANNLQLMTQAAQDLQKAYSTAYAQIIQADDAVSAALLKQRKFVDAVALYQPLAQATKPDIAADAQNKIGGIWLAAAKIIHYQSLPLEQRPEAEKRIGAAESAYLATLKNFPDQLAAVGDAFAGLVSVAKQRLSWGLLKEADLEGYLAKAGADLTSPEMAARLEMAKAGLVFITKDGPAQYPRRARPLPQGDRLRARPAPHAPGNRAVRRPAARGEGLRRRAEGL